MTALAEVEPGTVRSQSDPMGDGVYPDMTREEYVAARGVNFSTLKWFKQSAAHARDRMINRRASTPEQEFGTLVHLAILEPDRFAAECVVMPDFTVGLIDPKTGEPYKNPRGTTAYKQLAGAWTKENIGRQTCEQSDLDKCKAIGESIAAHSTASELLTHPDARTEVAVFWTDPETGLKCKALIDLWIPSLGIVGDLKTTGDARPWAFGAECHRLQYHVQAAYYVWGLGLAGHPIGEAGKFLHIPVESQPYHGVAVHELDTDSLGQGIKEFRNYLNQYAACQESGRWPGYADRIEPISIPRYALTAESQS